MRNTSMGLCVLLALVVCFVQAQADTIEYLKYAKCLLDVYSSDMECKNHLETFQEVGSQVKHLEVAKLKEEGKLGDLCCSFSSYVSCYFRQARKNCGEAGSSTQKYVLKFTESKVSSYGSNKCKDFDDTQCSAAGFSTASGLSFAIAVLLSIWFFR